MEKLGFFTSKTGQMKAVIRQALLDYPDIFVFSDEEDFAPHILTFESRVFAVKSLFMPLKTMIFSSQRPLLVHPRQGSLQGL